MNPTTERRALLGALVAMPALAVSVAAAAPVSGDLSTLDEAGLLELGARNADGDFARLCADALNKLARAKAASRLYDDASEGAHEATPEYPAGLRYQCRYRHTRGERVGQVDTWEERCEPDGEHASMLWNLSHRRAKAAGVSYTVADAQLRAEYAGWRAARDAARAHYMIDELRLADDAAWTAEGRARTLIRAYAVRNAEALLVKLHLHGNEDGADFDATQWAALIADVSRVLAS